jgi:HAMP domain-containing protein
MASRTRIPIYLKVLPPTLVAGAASAAVCLWLIDHSLREEQRYRGGETNATVIQALNNGIDAAFKLRFAELEALIPRVHADPSAFETLPTHLRAELLDLRLFSPRPGNGFTIRRFDNRDLLTSRGWAPAVIDALDRSHPIDLGALERDQDPRVFNRSIRLENGDPIPVFSLVLFGRSVDGDPHQTVIVADLIGSFLVAQLRPTPLTQLYLVNRDGTLFAADSIGAMADYASAAWPHPAAQAVVRNSSVPQGFRWDFQGQRYLAAIGPTSLPGVFAVSQISDADLFDVLALLRNRIAMAALACWCGCALIAVWLTSRTGRKLRGLAATLDRFSTGDFAAPAPTRSWDETAEVATAVTRIAREIPLQIEAAANRAKNESVRTLNQNVRAVLGSEPLVHMPEIDLCTHRPNQAVDCVDFWDCHTEGKRLTLILGRTEANEIGAALFATYAKSCLAAMRAIAQRAGSQSPPLARQLEVLSDALYLNYRGRHTLLVSAIEIDTESGICQIVNCGGETPFLVAADSDAATAPEAARIEDGRESQGPCLGAQAGTVFREAEHRLLPGEFVFLFTHNRVQPAPPEEQAIARDRLRALLLTSYHPTPQAMSAHVVAINPFGDELTFWLVEWRPLRLPIAQREAI